MPTFTAIPLERLIEPGAAKPMMTAKNGPDSKIEKRNNTSTTTTERGIIVPNSKLDRTNSAPNPATIDKKHHWARVTPSLYATPTSTPLPDAPSSFPPSPYIVNHKRRGPRLMKSYSEDDVAVCQRAVEDEKVEMHVKGVENEAVDLPKDVSFNVTISNPVKAEQVICTGDGAFGNINSSSSLAANKNSALHNDPTKAAALKSEDSELDDFLEPQDSVSVKSNNEGESSSDLERSLQLPAPMPEFYDAWEELSSDGGLQHSQHDVEAELREIRLSLLMEMEKRKQAEEALDDIRTQWMKHRQQLSLVGLTLAADPVAAEDKELGVDMLEDLCNQIYIARFVSNSIGRGTAKAEVEMEMEAEIDSKNFEIARLCDRLHYYETVNQEMSQRNQEAVEMARRHRQGRKRRQRWIWGSVAAAVTLGTGVLAWSYFSNGRGSSSIDKAPNPDLVSK
ncbi:hypothetical protein NMG60_11021249 [Bertholletia excelsa]